MGLAEIAPNEEETDVETISMPTTDKEEHIEEDDLGNPDTPEEEQQSQQGAVEPLDERSRLDIRPSPCGIGGMS